MDFKGTREKWEYKVIYGKKRPKITVQIPIREDFYQELVLGTIGEDDCTVASCCCREEHANALLISKSPLLLKAIKDSINELREVGLNDMANYHEKLYNECVNL